MRILSGFKAALKKTFFKAFADIGILCVFSSAWPSPGIYLTLALSIWRGKCYEYLGLSVNVPWAMLMAKEISLLWDYAKNEIYLWGKWFSGRELSNI